MSLDHFAASLHLFIAISSLVILWFCWRSYRVDALRENLFALRGDLFDYAATGGVSFDHKAYALLRIKMNGMIRFAHRISYARLALTLVFFCFSKPEGVMQQQKEWKDAVATLSPEKQKHLLGFHNQMDVLIVKHMVLGSPVLMLVLGVFVGVAIVLGVAMSLWRALTKLTPGLDLLEAQALVGQPA